MILPNFLCVGAQKAATTTLAAMLRKHEAVYMPKCKEVHYFDSATYQAGDARRYSEYYSDVSNEKIIADFTPVYLFFPEIPDRILNDLGPGVKILILLRHPLDRAISHYRMSYSTGYDNLTFTEAFYKEEERLKISRFSMYRHSYFQRGLYHKQINRYLKRFNSVKIMLFEDLIQNTGRTMDELCDFLEVERQSLPLVHKNTGYSPHSAKLNYLAVRTSNRLKSLLPRQHHKKIDKGLNAFQIKNSNSRTFDINVPEDTFWEMTEYFTEEIERLETLVDRDLSSWKKKKVFSHVNLTDIGGNK